MLSLAELAASASLRRLACLPILGPFASLPALVTQAYKQHPFRRGDVPAVEVLDRDAHRSRGDGLEREAAQAVAQLLDDPVANRQSHGVRTRRDQLADDTPGDVVDHHDLNFDPRSTERELSGGVLTADARQLDGRVEHQLGQLLVDGPPGPRRPRPGDHAIWHRFGGAQGTPDQFEQLVVGGGHESPSFGLKPGGRSRLRRSRHRARVGPMLPIGRPSISAMVW